jgi:hypothetical protein
VGCWSSPHLNRTQSPKWELGLRLVLRLCLRMLIESRYLPGFNAGADIPQSKRWLLSMRRCSRG